MRIFGLLITYVALLCGFRSSCDGKSVGVRVVVEITVTKPLLDGIRYADWLCGIDCSRLTHARTHWTVVHRDAVRTLLLNTFVFFL